MISLSNGSYVILQYREINLGARASATESRTVAQKSMVEKRIITSRLKAILVKNEYMAIHRSMTKVDPSTIIQVITVQYRVLKPTKRLAQKMAATEAVVPKSANESIAFPFHETAVPYVHTTHGMKKTIADW
jgi:uncharacterized membrane protein